MVGLVGLWSLLHIDGYIRHIIYYPIYLDFSSQHPQHNYSVTRTLFDRVKCIMSDSDDLKQELSSATAKSLFQLVDSLR